MAEGIEAVELLEASIGEWMGFSPENVVACSSGTAALHLALESLQLPQGSKVLVPDYTMVACARSCTLAGLEPVFLDCGPDLLIDTQKMKGLDFGGDVRAIMPVHIYGRRCNMDFISAFAKRRGMMVVEDMAELHGVKPHRDTDAACWSFYRNKIVGGKEGGAVAFRKEGHAALARTLRCLGFTREHNFQHVPRGHNYRLSDVHSLFIQSSLNTVNENMTSRRRLENIYNEAIPVDWHMPKRESPWVYDVRLPTERHVPTVVNHLNKNGIAARCGFYPMTLQVEYRQPTRVMMYSHSIYSRIMYLPLDPLTNPADVDRAVDLLVASVATMG